MDPKRQMMRALVLGGVLIVCGIVAITTAGDVSGQETEPAPMLYVGSATISAEPVPDRRYILEITPTDNTFVWKRVTFHLGDVQANETDTFTAGVVSDPLDLTFPRLPGALPKTDVITTVATDAKFDIKAIEIEHQPPVAGIPFNVSVMVFNHGAVEGTYPAVLYIDHGAYASQTVTVPPEGGTEVAFLVDLSAGQHQC